MFTQEFQEDPLFALSFHPEAPEYVLGLASGQVACFSYTSSGPTEKWATKRHKSSCRAIAYTPDGKSVFTAGSDCVIKKADATTGRVTAKAKIPSAATAMAVTGDWVVVGDENGGIRAFEMKSMKPVGDWPPDITEVETISAIHGLASSETGRDFAVAADTRLLHLNLRKPKIIARSEDQEDEILSGCMASDARSVWGMSEGVVTVWKNNFFEDQQSRIRIVKDGSVDSVVADPEPDLVIAGASDGSVCRLNVRNGKILWRGVHAHDEEVVLLDWDYRWRLVSGSMELLKFWDPLPGTEDAESQEVPNAATSESETDGEGREDGVKSDLSSDSEKVISKKSKSTHASEHKKDKPPSKKSRHN